MIVCQYCLQEIESRGERVFETEINDNIETMTIDNEDCALCDWCKEFVPVNEMRKIMEA